MGTARMVHARHACPKYLPMYYDDVSPDMIFLVHDRIQQYCTRHTSRHKMASHCMSISHRSRCFWL